MLLSIPEKVSEHPRRSFRRTLLGFSILAIFGVWVVWYIATHRDQFQGILDVPPSALVFLWALFFASMVCNGVLIRDVVAAFHINLRWQAWLSLAFVSSFVNFFMPMRGGAGVRAVYLKTVHRLSLTRFLSTMGAVYLVYLCVQAGLGLLAMVGLRVAGHAFSVPIAVLFGAILAGAGAAMLTPVTLPEYKKFPFLQIARVIEGWQTIRRDKRLILKLAITVGAFTFISFLQYRIAFGVYGVELPVAGTLFFVCARNMAMFVGLTPGSLGVVEALAAYLGQTLQYTTAESLMVQALIRTVSIVTLIAAFPFAVRLLGSANDSSLPATANDGNADGP